MDVLWSPWRYDYINSDKDNSTAESTGCVFCNILKSPASDVDKFIIERAGHNFVILNIYPYTSGHIMIVPFEHHSELTQASSEATNELMELTKKAQGIIKEVYKPQGINLGMNLGKAAGAGVAEHFHMHILPRWIGDANFMTAVAQTRTIPESLEDTFNKLKDKF